MILHGRVTEQAIDRNQIGTFHKELVVTSGRVPLAMVRKRWAANDGGTRSPVLLVHGFGQNRYAWHLPSRSLANHLARAGFDVFNVDLRGHGRTRQLTRVGSAGIDDYVREDIPAAVEEASRISGNRRVFLVGHSLGGLVSYAAAPELSGLIAGVVSIGSPYHFTNGSWSLSALALFVKALAAVGVRPWNLPMTIRPIGSLMRTFRRVAESPFYPIPVRGWHAGALEPHVLDEHLRLAFDRAMLHDLINMFEWANDRRFGGSALDYSERFEKHDSPLLIISGQRDDLAPPASVRPAFLRSRSRDKTYRALPFGHIDLLMGRDAPLSTWSLVHAWLDKRAAA
ncbi:alpha/beta hydrolase [Pendulispora albinea]|uniref:Alpha/beta hydrolase n=1 Tax=Pendulispora albinea TaxID=2741071 RepID=A0ABZ2M5C1_9BACT